MIIDYVMEMSAKNKKKKSCKHGEYRLCRCSPRIPDLIICFVCTFRFILEIITLAKGMLGSSMP